MLRSAGVSGGIPVTSHLVTIWSPSEAPRKKNTRRNERFLERAARIELATLAWKARALPLCNARGPVRRELVGRVGFEPTYHFREPNLQSGAINHSATYPRASRGRGCAKYDTTGAASSQAEKIASRLRPGRKPLTNHSPSSRHGFIHATARSPINEAGFFSTILAYRRAP